MIRSVKKLYPGRNSQDGAGVNLKRIFSRRSAQDTDPFLLLDFFDSKDPADYINGFPWHPHRGIETITYLISGKIEHGDSLGNKGIIEDYGCQWMTAGSGIIHQEMPVKSNRLLGAQLWLNLPEDEKMCMPKYRDITTTDLKIYSDPYQKVRILSGKYKGITGPVKGDYVDPIYLDISINKESVFNYTLSSTKTAFILLINGKLTIEKSIIDSTDTKAILLTKGDTVNITCSKDSRFFLVAADPLNQPIAWGGPIVMNTKKQLNTAFEELKNNTFLKHS